MPLQTPTKPSQPSKGNPPNARASPNTPGKGGYGWDENEEAKMFKEPKESGELSVTELANLAETLQQLLEKRGLLSALETQNDLVIPAVDPFLPPQRDRRRRLPIYYRLLARTKELLGDKENENYQHILICWTEAQSLEQEQWIFALGEIGNFLVAHPTILPLHNKLAQLKFVDGQDIPAFIDPKTGMVEGMAVDVQDPVAAYKEKSGKPKQRDGPWCFALPTASKSD